ncbi:MAG: hypothetical protein PHW34_03525 [Hespellia sp.]|nr:hypothetical protein [Hespellia sp.]
MENQIYQIYDRIFKRIFTLSNLAIINLINALFGANHSPDSKITYLNKEFVGRNLDKRFADILIEINGIAYHLEAQMTKAKNIVVRVFEYSFLYAMENSEENEVLKFPEPIVIYLDTATDIPKTSTLILNFGTQGSFEYKVKNFVYQEHEVRELNQKKMVILIPFQLLKLRKLVKKKPTEETWERLQKLILNDIIGSIKANLEVGNITVDDATELKELTLELYEHLYQHYEELGGYQEMKELLEGAMELPLDKYRIQIDELKREVETIKADKAKVEADKAKAEADKAEADEEIQMLKKKLADLQK